MYPDYDAPRLTGPYLDLHTEREAQKGRLGAEHHNLEEWALALTEHTGGIATAVLTAGRDTDNPVACLANVREETVAAGAAIVAFLEHLDTLHTEPTSA
ncbi:MULTISPECIES: hypothetical protein [Streptomyces]|uniref:Uncharacterized protein n=1 Tax=Streptomyces doudnae TaxID=3075536 RepID=A0ABD5EM34_9ACTN|nr:MULTISPECIES: hypothetical protein [unclassified Streptomyces]MDT0435673.1 hypothetical protein [Streptomyces sp. DSM 41981]MYQ62627.1 hypothetical protein [Streptomyces sp. SID4950]SCD41026.1 hypothetical protein GA0115242_1048133 [Streptomyces sp. SolWspMP-5a-2]